MAYVSKKASVQMDGLVDYFALEAGLHTYICIYVCIYIYICIQLLFEGQIRFMIISREVMESMKTPFRVGVVREDDPECN